MKIKTYTKTGRDKSKVEYSIMNIFGVDGELLIDVEETEDESDDKSKTMTLYITREESDRMNAFFNQKKK